MPLSDATILKAMEDGLVKIEPFRPACLQPNSYDLHLGSTLLTYRDRVLDAKRPSETVQMDIPPEGVLIEPNRLYLGVTEEYTETLSLVPYLDGKSSVGRLGLWVHVTAGGGDAGFRGHWTLELVSAQPLVVYAGMPIAQIRYEDLQGPSLRGYGSRGSKYQNQPGVPVASRMHLNWNEADKSWLPKEP